MREAIDKLLEFIHQHSEGSCPLCGAEDYPVLGDKKGYGEVLPEDAEEWGLEHHDDCPVTYLEILLRQPEGEFTKKLLAIACNLDELFLHGAADREDAEIVRRVCGIIDRQAARIKELEKQPSAGDLEADIAGLLSAFLSGIAHNEDIVIKPFDAKRLAECLNRQAEELKECRQILEKQLDRDKDPNDSLRDLVVVACNALYWARAKKKHFVMGKLKAELKDKEEEIEGLNHLTKSMQATNERLFKENEALKGE